MMKFFKDLVSPRERLVEETFSEKLPDGIRVKITVARGRYKGRSAIVIPTPPCAAYFNAQKYRP